MVYLFGVLLMTQGAADAAQVLYGFDTDENYRIADWLTGDGSQDAIGLGIYDINKSGEAAFGAGAIEFPVGLSTFGALELPDTSMLGDSFTLSVMAKVLGANHTRLFSSYNGGSVGANEFVFDMDTTGDIGFGLRAIVNGTSVSRNIAYNDSQYHHLAMTYDNGSVQLYFDGSPLGESATAGSGAITLDQNLRFGEDYAPTSLTNEVFEGFADDILVYDRALSSTEIASLRTQGAESFFGISAPPEPDPLPPPNIGSRIEMFVDRYMVAESNNVELKLHAPVAQEIALQLNGPYETTTSTYFTALRDEDDKYRLYYRGYVGSQEVTLMAISDDGINYTRHELGLYEVDGSDNNHIVWQGAQSHNLSPFIDKNPNAPADEKWKALGGTGEMYAMKSADGIHWELMQDEPLDISGQFDSQNTAMWDAEAGVYRSFSRIWLNGVRAIQMSTSEDFINWTPPQPFIYEDDMEHFYTNSIEQLPGAEGVFVGFPMRLDPTRTNQPSPGQTGVSDAVLITSRDGVHWDREFTEPWIPEGYDTTRSHMPAWGIVKTADDEWSTYSTEQYRLSDNRLRRLTLRPYGIASISAEDQLGWFSTPTFEFEGEQLLLNYQTTDTGFIAVEIRDENGVVIPGFELASMQTLTGDELWQQVSWTSGQSVGSLSGQSIQLYFELLNADLFAMQFAEIPDTGLVGDYNNDGKVDLADYTVWRDNLGSEQPLANDAIGGTIGVSQYEQWKSQFGQSIAGDNANSQAVPEGRSVVHLSLAIVLFGAVVTGNFRRC
ncbi:LamG-like jellyroll fold domain-containing protein [Aeoliella mucimassa]|nr:LamG-like jellyroll fold domain-containing protein [Aeoliella mucimassa]